MHDELIKKAERVKAELLAFHAKYGPGLRPNDVTQRGADLIDELIAALKPPSVEQESHSEWLNKKYGGDDQDWGGHP